MSLSGYHSKLRSAVFARNGCNSGLPFVSVRFWVLKLEAPGVRFGSCGRDITFAAASRASRFGLISSVRLADGSVSL